MSQPAALMFDLGGVIVPWVGMDGMAKLTQRSRNNILSFFGSDNPNTLYETGEISSENFANKMIDTFALELTIEAFLNHWNSWVHPPFSGVIDALQTLKTRYTTACLSNTNASHWAYLTTHLDVTEQFHYPMASHIMKCAKPSHVIYEKAIKTIGVPPQDIWFFDDSSANVIAARDSGLIAHHVDNRYGVLPVLQSLGLIT